MQKHSAILEQFEKALARFQEILEKDKDEIIRDSAIKRFEFTFDLLWKLVKLFLEEKLGVVCHSPKGCFRDAFHQGLLDYDEFWLAIVDMRNDATHLYSEREADKIYENLPKVQEYFKILFVKIKECETEQGMGS